MTTSSSTAGRHRPGSTQPAQGGELMDAPVAERDAAGRWLHGRPKSGGRAPGTPNRDRSVTIERIVKLADPIGTLCRIANGEPMLQAPEPGAEPALTHPTMADRLTALKVLAAKVMPDLKQISVDDGGALVQVWLQLGQKVTIGQ